MRYLLAAILSGSLMLGTSSVTLAQHGGGGHGGGGHGGGGGMSHGGYSGGHSGGSYGHSSGYYGHGGGYYGHGGYYGNYWYPGIGLSIGFPLWFNYPWGYSQYDYGLGAPYYNGAYYYDPAGTTVSPPPPPNYDAMPAPAQAPDPNVANVEVRVPENAKIWIDGQTTTPTGAVRHFVSPPLEKDKSFTYEIRALWTDANGKEIDQTKKVQVKAGGWIGVNFNKQS